MICRRDRPAFLLAAVALFLGSCGEAAADLAPIEQVRADLAAGKPADAQVKLDRLLAEGSEPSGLAAYLGEAALAQGDLSAAQGWLLESDFAPETRAHGLHMLGRLYFAQGSLVDAGRAFDRSLAIAPDNPELWVDIGRLRYRGGEQLQAIEAAERALRLDPRSAIALRFRGQLMRDAQGLGAGLEWFARAVEVQPDSPELRVEYAASLGDAGRAAEALAALRSGDGSATRTPRGVFVQAVIAARAGRSLLARALLDRSGLEREGVPSAMMVSALVDLQAGNFASATQTLDQLAQRQPDNARVADLLAFALSRAGADRALVRRFADRADGPLGTPYLRTLVGRSYEALDDRESAARYLDAAVTPRAEFVILNGGHPQDYGTNEGLDAREFVRDALRNGQAVAAVQRARDLVRQFPGSADAYSLLGDAEFAAGNKAAAREAYLRSAAVHRTWPLALRLLRSETDDRAARRLLEDIVRSSPANGEAAAMLADAYAAEGKWGGAATLLDHAIAHGQARVPWVLSARSIAAAKLGDHEAALDFALDAHAMQPTNPSAIAALIAALPVGEADARAELQSRLRSLTAR